MRRRRFGHEGGGGQGRARLETHQDGGTPCRVPDRADQTDMDRSGAEQEVRGVAHVEDTGFRGGQAEGARRRRPTPPRCEMRARRLSGGLLASRAHRKGSASRSGDRARLALPSRTQWDSAIRASGHQAGRSRSSKRHVPNGVTGCEDTGAGLYIEARTVSGAAKAFKTSGQWV